MKPYIYILLVIIFIFFSACSYEWWTEDFSYWFCFEDDVSTMAKVFDWTSTNITYASDKERYDRNYIQTPKQTYETRLGDCDDFAVMAAYLCYNEVGIEDVQIVILMHKTVTIGYQYLGHTIVRVEGNLWEPQRDSSQFLNPPTFSDWIIIDEFHIRDFLWAVTHAHEYFGVLTLEEINNAIKDLAFLPVSQHP